MSDSETDTEETVPLRPAKRAKIEWKFEPKGASVNFKFYVQYLSGIKPEKRKCIKCTKVITATNGGTTAMKSHLKTCTGERPHIANQPCSTRTFEPSSSVKNDNGMRKICKLVYQDNIPINKIVNSATLKEMFQKLGYDKVTKDRLNNCLNREYDERVTKNDERWRDKRNKLVSTG